MFTLIQLLSFIYFGNEMDVALNYKMTIADTLGLLQKLQPGKKDGQVGYVIPVVGYFTGVQEELQLLCAYHSQVTDTAHLLSSLACLQLASYTEAANCLSNVTLEQYKSIKSSMLGKLKC